ncbi:6-pyruvoyl trahydropterin synthase family protein [Fastidiosibacter lacustris]|uniref:6-pyruvoyl trahydropterin synthase family protein n=1 Tax=Fastidiosibacter lacustris TaxID=2056695 RepID=UPI000E3515FC|nr:6-carboxytetrahydropterin synthase [Fastidiosibacter lacustris]
MIYRIEKCLDGFSTCFRQWNAIHSHCRFLHGYAISFRLHFKANQLDQHNWVWDFGWLKDKQFLIDGMTTKEWFHYMFDHTIVLSEKDPALSTFKALEEQGLIQLRTLPYFSCEGIAEFVLNKLGSMVLTHSNNRAQLYRVDVMENNKNLGAAEIE